MLAKQQHRETEVSTIGKPKDMLRLNPTPLGIQADATQAQQRTNKAYSLMEECAVRVPMGDRAQWARLERSDAHKPEKDVPRSPNIRSSRIDRANTRVTDQCLAPSRARHNLQQLGWQLHKQRPTILLGLQAGSCFTERAQENKKGNTAVQGGRMAAPTLGATHHTRRPCTQHVNCVLIAIRRACAALADLH
jgi:hypothetical protein